MVTIRNDRYAAHAAPATTRRARGMTMAETAMVLGVATVLIGGGTMLYRSMTAGAQDDALAQEVHQLAGKMREVGRRQGTYAGINAISKLAVPEHKRRGSVVILGEETGFVFWEMIATGPGVLAMTGRPAGEAHTMLTMSTAPRPETRLGSATACEAVVRKFADDGGVLAMQFRRRITGGTNGLRLLTPSASNASFSMAGGAVAAGGLAITVASTGYTVAGATAAPFRLNDALTRPVVAALCAGAEEFRLRIVMAML